MTLVDQLRADYARFPREQSYQLYDPAVKFEDPISQFQGRETYQWMIGLMAQWFKHMQMDLHEIEQKDAVITTRWTLSWDAPLPWKRRIQVQGRSILHINAQGLIDSHVDYWDISRWQVLQQHF